VARAVRDAERALATDAWQLSDTELRDAMAELARGRSVLDAAHLSLVRQLADRLTGGSATEAVVRETTRASAAQARRDVAAARVVGPGAPLAGFGERLADGAVSREHVDVAVRCLDGIPRRLAEDRRAPEVISQFLLRAVDAGASPLELRRAVDQLLDRLDPDRAGRFDPDADQRRFLDMHTDSTGMVVGRFQLDPVAGAALRNAVHVHSAPLPAQVAGNGTVVRDPRSTRQRFADALSTIVDLAMGVSTPRRGERPRIVVHTTATQLAHVGGAGQATTESGEVLSTAALDRLACDAVLQRVVLEPSAGPLDVGREHRLVTVAQRRALEARDGGCLICSVPAAWCDAHHVVPWASGGASDLSNLVLLCPSHHTAVHSGAWQVERDPTGGLLLVPPRWVDPRRVPRAPVHHQLTALLRELDDAAETELSDA
jgi:hypothetical protein